MKLNLQHHEADLKRLLGLNLRKGSIWGSSNDVCKILSYHPLTLAFGNNIKLSIRKQQEMIIVAKWDERACDETVVLEYPSNNLLSKTRLGSRPELIYALLIGMDSYGMSAHPIWEIPTRLESKEGDDNCKLLPALKCLNVANSLRELSPKSGLNYWVKDPYPLSLHVRLS